MSLAMAAPPAGRAEQGLPSRWKRLAMLPLSAIVGSLLCLTPVTAVLALGFLVRQAKREAAITIVRHASGATRREALRRLSARPDTSGLAAAPGWLMHLGAKGVARLIGGGWVNLREGLVALLANLLVTLPFGMLWLGAWWGGWENSFNKGYEQANVGQIVALAGAILALVMLRHLPMALAHQAATGRLSAVLEWRLIGRLTRAAGWRSLAITVWVAFAAVAVAVVRAVPVVAETAFPGFDPLDSQSVAMVAGRMALAGAAIAFLSAAGYRLWSARLYARAVLRMYGAGEPRPVWCEPLLDSSSPRTAPIPLPGRLATLSISLVATALNAVLVASIFVAQFFNHSWVLWATHPVAGLPWLP